MFIFVPSIFDRKHLYVSFYILVLNPLISHFCIFCSFFYTLLCGYYSRRFKNMVYMVTSVSVVGCPVFLCISLCAYYIFPRMVCNLFLCRLSHWSSRTTSVMSKCCFISSFEIFIKGVLHYLLFFICWCMAVYECRVEKLASYSRYTYFLIYCMKNY